jgi:tRNA(Ile2) C34 agmatinyltransferase TiaS
MIAVLLVLPAWAYGLSTGNPVLVLGGLPLASLMIYYSIAKRVCPGCGKAVRAIGRAPANCMYCGASYEQSPAVRPLA